MTDTTKQLQSAEAGPRRIQLKRTKGWRMPDNTVKVDRSTVWGNPFTIEDGKEALENDRTDVSDTEALAWCIEVYRDYLKVATGMPNGAGRPLAVQASEVLRGKNLACWCKPGAACHADVLLELANAPLLSAAAVEGSDV